MKTTRMQMDVYTESAEAYNTTVDYLFKHTIYDKLCIRSKVLDLGPDEAMKYYQESGEINE